MSDYPRATAKSSGSEVNPKVPRYARFNFPVLGSSQHPSVTDNTIQRPTSAAASATTCKVFDFHKQGIQAVLFENYKKKRTGRKQLITVALCCCSVVLLCVCTCMVAVVVLGEHLFGSLVIPVTFLLMRLFNFQFRIVLGLHVGMVLVWYWYGTCTV